MSHAELIAALALSGADMQEALQLLTIKDLPIGEGEGEGEGEGGTKQGGVLRIIVDANDSTNEIFSGNGDFDGDGVLNRIEAERSDGTVANFLELATDGTGVDLFCPGGLSVTPPTMGNFSRHLGDLAGFGFVALVLLAVALRDRRRAVTA